MTPATVLDRPFTVDVTWARYCAIVKRVHLLGGSAEDKAIWQKTHAEAHHLYGADDNSCRLFSYMAHHLLNYVTDGTITAVTSEDGRLFHLSFANDEDGALWKLKYL